MSSAGRTEHPRRGRRPEVSSARGIDPIAPIPGARHPGRRRARRPGCRRRDGRRCRDSVDERSQRHAAHGEEGDRAQVRSAEGDNASGSEEGRRPKKAVARRRPPTHRRAAPPPHRPGRLRRGRTHPRACPVAPDGDPRAGRRGGRPPARQRRRDGLPARRDDRDPSLRHGRRASPTTAAGRGSAPSASTSAIGMFGMAAASGEVVVTGDYPTDPSFVHFPDADRLVRDLAIHSFARRTAGQRRPDVRGHGHVLEPSRTRSATRTSPSSVPSPTTPPRRCPTPTSSSSSAAREPTSSAAPRRRAGPPRDRRADHRPPALRRTSSSDPSTRLPAC